MSAPGPALRGTPTMPLRIVFRMTGTLINQLLTSLDCSVQPSHPHLMANQLSDVSGCTLHRRTSLGRGFWSKWRSHATMLRSALSLEHPNDQLQDLLEECLVIYKLSMDDSPSIHSVLENISGRNKSPLEVAFMWLGGWRPTTAIAFVYSNMGVEIRESPSLSTQKLSTRCVLSEVQLAGMEALYKHMREAEVDLSNQLSMFQMLIVDQSMTNALRLGCCSCGLRELNEGRALLEIKLQELKRLFLRAERLRLRTLQELFHLLTPKQAAQCCIAGFELSSALRALGVTASSPRTKCSLFSERADSGVLSISDPQNLHHGNDRPDGDGASEGTSSLEKNDA